MKWVFSLESLIHLGHCDKADCNLAGMAEKETEAKINPTSIRISTNPVVLLIVIASPENKIFDHFFLFCVALG